MRKREKGRVAIAMGAEVCTRDVIRRFNHITDAGQNQSDIPIRCDQLRLNQSPNK